LLKLLRRLKIELLKESAELLIKDARVLKMLSQRPKMALKRSQKLAMNPKNESTRPLILLGRLPKRQLQSLSRVLKTQSKTYQRNRKNKKVRLKKKLMINQKK